VDAFISEARLGQEARSHSLGHTLELLDLRPHTAQGWPPVALVMEYYPCSLAQVLEQCAGFRFPAAQVARWARDLATALADLHDRYHQVHRDVKPGNIMFRLLEGRYFFAADSLVGEEAVLTDFGTICKAGEESPITVFQDRWKDPLLYPPRP